MSRKKAISTIYFKNVLVREISIPINKIGSNLNNIIKAKLANNLEGKCSKEGYIKKGSIEILTYSSGILECGFVNFNVSFVIASGSRRQFPFGFYYTRCK